MKNYHVTIMSIDPDLSDEDNHQKYGYTVEANNEKEAKEKAIAKLDGLPVFWIKCFEVGQPEPKPVNQNNGLFRTRY